jgi:hypothetical protein
VARARASSREFEGSVVNVDTVSAFLGSFYPDRVQTLPPDGRLSKLVADLHLNGITTIGQLKFELNRGYHQFCGDEQDYPPMDMNDSKVEKSRYSAIGAARRTLELTYPEFD